MNRLLIQIFSFCLISAIASSVFAAGLEVGGVPNADNPHNLSNLSNNTIKAQPVATGGSDQICIFCHTPHSATADSPLWSRPDPALGSFPLYNSPLVIAGTLGGDPTGQVTRSQYDNADPAAYPNGASRLCLSCHDGVTAIGLLRDNTTINMLGGSTLNDFSSQAVIDLSTSHPISFVYDSNVLGDLTAYYGASTYSLPSASYTPLDGQTRMQCTTCHDPHNDTFSANSLPFWRKDTGNSTNDYEDVCNSCHLSPGFTFPGSPTGDHNL